MNGYVHDIYIKDGVAHAGLIYDGLYVLLDVSTCRPISVLGSTLSARSSRTPPGPPRTASTAIVADEKGGQRNLEMWDVTDPARPRPSRTSRRGPTPCAHNPYIRGNVAHVSYYERGYIAFDISDPTRPGEDRRVRHDARAATRS